MIIKEIGPFDLEVSESSDSIKTSFRGPISVQPNAENVMGNPTYTLEVSNDDEKFYAFDDLSTNIKMTKAVQINYNPFPWEFIRITTVCNTGDSGVVTFKIGISDR